MGAVRSCMAPGKQDKKQRAVESQRSTMIDSRLIEMSYKEAKIPRVIFLGAGESGKSTMFKQLRLIYDTGFDKSMRSTYKIVVHSTIMKIAKTLVVQCEKLALLGDKMDDPGLKRCMIEGKKARVAAERVRNLWELDSWFSPQLVRDIDDILQDPGAQNAMERYWMRFHPPLPDNTKYFASRIGKIAEETYIPSDQDILRARVRSVCIEDRILQYGDVRFQFIDVGGQRGERRKWIHCFSNVTTVLYVLSLSAYSERLIEDRRVNRMTEAVALFSEISAMSTFRSTSIIVFLNKYDIFEKRIKTIPFSSLFEDFDEDGEDPCCCAEYLKFVISEQSSKARRRKGVACRQIYYHLTTAVDTNLMRKIFESCSRVIVSRSIEDAGLMFAEEPQPCGSC